MTNQQEQEPHVTMRVWKKTRQILRRIKAETEEDTLIEIIHRLAQEEWKRRHS